jgi:hypothetical protein
LAPDNARGTACHNLCIDRCVPDGVEMAKRNRSEPRMKQDERSTVRKRTKQLVFLELGHDNGGIILNLSEDGCAFQAIAPVKLGKTRFAFQISGGQRIAADGEVRWIDEPGITGGLQFLDLQGEERMQIRIWLNDTRAAQEPEEVPPRETRQNSLSDGSKRVMEEPEMPPRCAYMPAAAAPTLEDVWAKFPLLREGLFCGASHAWSGSLSLRIAVLLMVVMSGALLYVNRPGVANSLISLGEAVTGRSKAYAVVPEVKSPEPVNPQLSVNGTPEKAEAETPPNRESEMTPSEEPDPAKPNVTTGNAERTGSVHEEQAVWHDLGANKHSAGVPAIRKAEPLASEDESVASLWQGLQGGSVSAELSLAERFIRGYGVAKNCDQASVLLRAAANKGNREARLRLYQLDSGGCQ